LAANAELARQKLDLDELRAVEGEELGNAAARLRDRAKEESAISLGEAQPLR
jgi:hypothetical protein